jgi:hypothetical protein
MSSNRTKVESSIPNWVLYVLAASISLIIAKTVHNSVAIIAGLGIISLITLSYLSKPVAEIQTPRQKNIFDKNKINRSTWNNPSEPNAQRRRYLRSIDDIDKAA